MRRKFWGVIGAVVLALVGTFVLVAYVNGAESRALEGESIVSVLVVKAEIPVGTAAKDLGDRVGRVQIASKVKADGAVTDVKQLGDRVASAKLVPGEQIVTARFVEPAQIGKVGAFEIPAGKLQVTVGLDPERAVGGDLVPGNTVAVIASFDPFEVSSESTIEVDGIRVPGNGKTPNSSHIILHKVLVTEIALSEVPDEDAKDAAPKGQLLVTLALDGPDVEKVVFAAEHGSLWLAKEPVDASETGTKVQTRGTVYR